MNNFQDEVRTGKAERGPHNSRVQGDPLQGIPQSQADAELLSLLVVVVIRHSNQPRSALFPGTYEYIQSFPKKDIQGFNP